MRAARLHFSMSVGSMARVAVWLVALLGAFSPVPAASFYTLSTNGPASNRVAVVFFAEGYTSNQSGLFLARCTNAIEFFTAVEPFKEYSNSFNFFAIFTNSVQAGSDHPYSGTNRNTYFNSSYDAAADYIITIPPNAFDANPANGQGKVDSLLATYLPTNLFPHRLPIMLVNDSTDGGSAGQMAIVATWTFMAEVLIHEVAHVFGGLGDEYDSAGGYADSGSFGEEPNTTQQTNRNLIKWKAWIDSSTPIPTPNDPTNANVVGLFEGAHYSATNWFRPKYACRMRYTSGVDFCEVCRETLVKTIYSKIRPWDAVLPDGNKATLIPGQASYFSVTPLQPASHSLSVQWQTNGVNVVGATNTALPVPAQPGLTSVSVIVRDSTDWVRNDPAGVMAATNTWALSSLWIESAQALPGSQFRFTVRGSGLTNFSIKASTNLTQWSSIATNALSGGQFQFTNSGLSSIPWRYYRAVAPPQ